MRKFIAVALVTALVIICLSVLIIAQTSSTPSWKAIIVRSDQADRPVDQPGLLDETAIAHMEALSGYFDEMYGDWKQIHDHFETMLEITNQQQLREEMDKHYEMLQDFDRRAGEMHILSHSLIPGPDYGKDGSGDTKYEPRRNAHAQDSSVLR